MYRIWSERTIPQVYLPLFDEIAVADGCARDTPDTPFVALPGAAAIIASSRLRYNAAAMDLAPTLRIIARTGIGINNIDLTAATERGIMVCNVPDGPSVSTAEHAFALMMALAKQLKSSDRRMRDMIGQDAFSTFDGIELRGRTLGLIGLGRIGGRVAHMASALGMLVIAYDPFVPPGVAERLGVEIVPSLDALLGAADVVSLHVPSTTETYHLINRDTLARMRPGAFLINCARGDLVDETALLAALEQGHLRGVGLDVFDPEPPAPDNPLLHRDDVIATPHVAGATDISKDQLWRGAILQVVQALKGERPANLVNHELAPV